MKTCFMSVLLPAQTVSKLPPDYAGTIVAKLPPVSPKANSPGIRKVALWLGHASLQSTEVYLRADPTEKLAAMAALVPPNV